MNINDFILISQFTKTSAEIIITLVKLLKLYL